MEREEGDLDLRRERRGGRDGRGGGVGERGAGLGVIRLLGTLKAPLPLCLSLPEEEDGAYPHSHKNPKSITANPHADGKTSTHS